MTPTFTTDSFDDRTERIEELREEIEEMRKNNYANDMRPTIPTPLEPVSTPKLRLTDEQIDEIRDAITDAVRDAAADRLDDADSATPPIEGYDTDSDERAHLACSECGERIESVPDRDGAVCGCAEPPAGWTLAEL